MLKDAREALAFIQSKSPQEIKEAIAERNGYISGAIRFNGGSVSPSEMGVWSENEIAQVILCDFHCENCFDYYDYEHFEEDEEAIYDVLYEAVQLIEG